LKKKEDRDFVLHRAKEGLKRERSRVLSGELRGRGIKQWK
jgi:hypothetical protein